jgi:hypothetical protein
MAGVPEFEVDWVGELHHGSSDIQNAGHSRSEEQALVLLREGIRDERFSA